MITLENVNKRYESTVAVKNLNLTTASGEIFGILGPNGAGKSTTIKMIMNILAPDTGSILFDGKPITPKDRDLIGYLPEERGIYKKVTVREFITYLGVLKGKTPGELNPEIDRWLKYFGLFEWAEKKTQDLSKGMSQKVQFIASIIHNPSFIILDEPFSGLDPVSTDKLREAILELKNMGKTILFSTHIMEQAEKICSNILLMNKGDTIVQGNVSDIKQSMGHKSISIEFEGDGSFIKTMDEVEKVIEYPRFVEVELKDEKLSDEFLKKVINKVSVKRFEKLIPSLHKIFVDKVGGIDE